MNRISGLNALSPEKRALLQKRLAQRGLRPSRAPGIAARGDASPVPLSFLQEGLWFIDQLDPGKATYNVPMTARLRGDLDLAALESALRQIYERHESLRTTFRVIAGEARQVIGPVENFALQVVDLRRRADAEAEGMRLALEEARQPMDLAAGPLFRAAVVRMPGAEHLLLITIHHIITDGWSMGVLTRELIARYAATVQGRPSPLKPLPIQFGDYALWQRSQLHGERLDKLLRFWSETLSGHRFVLDLPVDHERPARQSGRGQHLTFRISPELTEALRSISKRENVTLFALMLGVFYCLLSGLSGQNDLIVGTPIANRNRSDLEGLIGYFVNQVPLRARLEDDCSIRALARQVHQITVEANTYQELPFGRLVEELQPPRDASRNPIFQVEFTLLDPAHAPPVYGYGFNSPVPQEIDFAGLSLTPVKIESEASKFDLTVLLWDMPGGIGGTFEYDADLFKEAAVRRMMENYAALLAHVSTNPALTVLNLKEIQKKRNREQKNAAQTPDRRTQA